MAEVPDSSMIRDGGPRADAIRLLVRDCFGRRSAGEYLTDETLIAAHPELMPELALELAKLRRLEAAWRGAEEESFRSAAKGAGPAASAPLSVRCPHCHSPTPVTVDSSLSDIRCSSCGAQFSLVGTSEDADRGGAARHVGRFELLEQIGVGGFGAVWKARDPELDRLVALKIPRRGQLSEAEAEQFFREARAAAQLRHPHIVSVHEVGRDDERIYIVSDLVEGPSLAEWNADQRISVREAAIFCQKVSLALQHAHEAGIVHRDLKPANILLDENAEPHLTDFGLASRHAHETTVTVDGQMLGTPAYMSPEQARGEAHQADSRSDLFALGVILYELLTGELPFRGSVRMLLEQILEHEPTSPRSLNSLVPRDLETICLKCLEKDPARRYASAQELADDLGRFLRSEPIRARPVSRLERTWRWCKRRPAQAALVVVLAAVAIAAPIVALQQSESRRAAQEQAKASRWQQYLSDMHAAMQAWHSGDVGNVVQLLGRHEPPAGKEDLRGFEWYYLWKQCQPGMRALTLTLPGPAWGVAFSPDGRTVATGGADEAVRLWDAHTGRLRQTLAGNIDEVHHLAFSPDGKTLASGGGSNEEPVHLWDLSTGTLQHTLRCGKGGSRRPVFSDDGTKVAAGGDGGIVMVWDVQSGAELQVLRGHTGKCHVCGPWDGRTLWSVGLDGTLRYWDAATGELVRTVTRGEWQGYVNVAFSLDGRTVAMGHHNGSIRLIDKASGQDAYTLIGHRGGVHGLAFSGDGRLLASADDRGNIIIWNLVSRQRQRTLRGHAGFVRSLSWSPDGKRVASASGDGTVKVWDDAFLADDSLCHGHTWTVHCVAFDPLGRLLASGSADKTVKLWDAATCALLRTLEGHMGLVGDVAFSPDGELLASASDEEVRLWDVATGQSRATLMVHSGYVGSLAFGPNGKWLASGGDDGTVRLWDPETGQLVRSIAVGRGPIRAVRFSGHSGMLAVGLADGSISLCHPRDGKELAIIRSTANLHRIALSPSGESLAACSQTQETVELYTLTGKELMHFDHGARVEDLAFSPDGHILVTSGLDRGVRLWDLATGHERAAFVEGLGQFVRAIAFSPDGTVLAAGDEDGTIYLWRAASVPLALPVQGATRSASAELDTKN